MGVLPNVPPIKHLLKRATGLASSLLSGALLLGLVAAIEPQEVAAVAPGMFSALNIDWTSFSPLTAGSGVSITGTWPNQTISNNASSVGGSPGQIQYNNAGVFGGFTFSGDLTLVPSTGVATISAGAVTASKMASGAAASNLGAAGGDLSGTFPNPTVLAENGHAFPTSATNSDLAVMSANGMYADSGTQLSNVSLLSQIIRGAGGRLTQQSHTPVMATTQSGKSTIYYDAYAGNYAPFFNGSIDGVDTISGNELSLTLEASGTGLESANGVFDVWWFHNGGSPVLCVATNGSGGGWASDTGGTNQARGTGYSQLDFSSRSYPTNANALANCYNGTTNYGSIAAHQATYLGTFATDPSTAGSVSWNIGGSSSGGTAGYLNLWNYYNRVESAASSIDTGASYTYSSTTTREARASAGNQINFVVGVVQDAVNVYSGSAISTVATAGAYSNVAPSLNSITGFTLGAVASCNPPTAASLACATTRPAIVMPGVGIQYLARVEMGDGTHANSIDISSNDTISVAVRN